MRDNCDTTSEMGAACVMVTRRNCSARRWWGAASTLAAFLIGALPATGTPLAPRDFDALASKCAIGVSAEVLRSVASKESHFEPLALHDNTRKITRIAGDAKAAAVLAEKWIAAGDSVDVGLMQINAPNLAPLGLTVAQAFDPCFSLAAGAAVLRAAYNKGASAAEQQAALLIMLSRYNTGRPLNGLVNGYVGDIISPKPAVAPAPANTDPTADDAQPPASPLPAWDVWANADYAQTHGAAWLVNLSTAPSASRQTPPKGTISQKPQ